MAASGNVFNRANHYPQGVVTLTDAATIAVDATKGDVFDVTLGGSRTLGNPTGAKDGQSLCFRIRQDDQGSRGLTLGSKFRFNTDIADLSDISTTAGAKDTLVVQYDETDDRFDVVGWVVGAAAVEESSSSSAGA